MLRSIKSSFSSVTGLKMTKDKKQLCGGYFDKFKEKFDDIKKFIAHIGLYVGLIVFTALGALVYAFLLD